MSLDFNRSKSQQDDNQDHGQKKRIDPSGVHKNGIFNLDINPGFADELVPFKGLGLL